MAVVLLAIMLAGLLIIATEPLNHISKAAVAMFAGVCCWLLYIAQGNNFVSSQHAADYAIYLADNSLQAHSIKDFIASNIFFNYVVKGANIVLFLIATTSIVEILNNNGCFDFAAEWMRTRKPRKLLWLLFIFTFVLSANLDNLATVVLMLTIMHPVLQSDKQRRIYGTVIVLAANCGGAITVIGDITSLRLWNDQLVTPSTYFLTLVMPMIAAAITILTLLARSLPPRVELSLDRLPFRGDDTVLTRPQRLLMLLVGIGGLWFIPSFHRITLLPPFVGALCVLALLWIVNELCNRQLLGSDKMVAKRMPLALQYANLQNLLYYVGLTLMLGAVAETGVLQHIATWLLNHIGNIWILGGITTVLASLFGNIPTLLASTEAFGHLSGEWSYLTACNGTLWPLISYTTALGGSVLLTGSVAGMLLMRMEGISFGWYLRHIAPKVLTGTIVGYIVLLAQSLVMG